jgi:hypothetical protein
MSKRVYAEETPNNNASQDQVSQIGTVQPVNATEEDTNLLPNLLITELSPNSKGGGTDYFEYFELYNNTDKPLSLANYSFNYRYTDGSNTPDVVFSIPNTTIEPQKTIVFWFNNGSKTLAEFNSNFGSSLTSEQVVEFKDKFPGFSNGGNRALVIKDKAGTEVISASYLADDNDNNGNGIEYKYPTNGTQMEKYRGLTPPTPGIIDLAQVPSKPVIIGESDTEAPVITHTPVKESNAYSPIKIDVKITDNKAVAFATLYYKKEGDESFTSLSMNASASDKTNYSVEIPSQNVDSNITYYIEASDGSNNVKTEENVIQVKKPTIEYSKLPHFLVTEVVPDSTNVGSADGYEFIEIYNNSDKDINFKDYKLHYRYGADPTSDVIWPSEPSDVVIPSKKTLVFWIINGENNNSTVADFNANYGTNLVENKDIVKIYSGGMANGSHRGLVVTTNKGKEISVAYYNDVANVIDSSPDKGILFKYPVDNSTKQVKISAGVKKGTPGYVEPSQVPPTVVHINEDNNKPTIENLTKVKEVNQKENIKILANASDKEEIKSVRLFYRTNDQTKYSEAILPEDFDDMMYHYTIHSPDIIGKKYVEYYFVVSDGTNEVTSDNYKIDVTSDLDNSPLRLNVKKDDILKGEKVLRGTSVTDSPDKVKLFIDGSEETNKSYQSVEHEAYFAFEVSGVDMYFQNGVTMGDDIIQIFDDSIINWDTVTVPEKQCVLAPKRPPYLSRGVDDRVFFLRHADALAVPLGHRRRCLQLD